MTLQLLNKPSEPLWQLILMDKQASDIVLLPNSPHQSTFSGDLLLEHEYSANSLAVFTSIEPSIEAFEQALAAAIAAPTDAVNGFLLPLFILGAILTLLHWK